MDLTLLTGGNAYEKLDVLHPNVAAHLLHFILECVVKTYSARHVTDWIEKNAGKTTLDMITASDVAYAIVVVENSGHVWDQQERIKTLPEEEQEKYKNPKLLPPEEQEEYAKEEPKYTRRKGRRAGYMTCGWSKKGKLRYMEIVSKWDALFKNEDWKGELRVMWEDFIEESGVCSYWTKGPKKSRGTVDTNSFSEDDDEVCDDDQFFCRGDSSRLAPLEQVQEKALADESEDMVGEDSDSDRESEGQITSRISEETSSGSDEGVEEEQSSYGRAGRAKRPRRVLAV